MRRHTIALLYLWGFTWPAMLSNICIPLANTIDLAMLGRLNVPQYLSAIAIASMVLSSIFWLFNFIRLGTTGLTSSAYGGHNKNKIALCLYQSIIFAFLLSIIALGCKNFLAKGIFSILKPEADTLEYAYIYFNIRSYSIPAIFICFAIIGWMIGIQKPKYPLYILVSTSVSNIFLNLFLILYLKMNIEGVALGSVIADYIGLTVGIIIVARTVNILPSNFSLKELLNLDILNKLLIVNRHLFFRMSFLLLVNFFCVYQAIRLGEYILAVNSLLFNMVFLISSSLDGFAHAAEALIGKSLAKKNNLNVFRLYVSITGLCSVICSIILSIIIFLGKDQIISLLTITPEVISEMRIYYNWLVFMPIFACWCYWLDGVFIGALRTDKMQNTLIISVMLIFFPCWYFTQKLNNHGIWLAYSIFVIARGISLAIEFYKIDRQKKWTMNKLFINNP